MSDERYSNAFECIPADRRYCPPRTLKRPRVLGPQTAIVTGPSGEEIHTDAHGRIKVHFPWDRLNPADDCASCWLRVAQSWAGRGFGTWFLPRVGMEVVVEFLEGNPDRPLVTGCVYNPDTALPYPLPDEKTKSTIKTQSSPGGEGFNELRFEDAKDAEEIWIHAQKDLNVKVLNNESTSVDIDQSLQVGGNQTIVVKGNQTITFNTQLTTSRVVNPGQTFTLDPTAGGTLLRVVQEGFRPEQKQASGGARYGWQNFLGKLETTLAGMD